MSTVISVENLSKHYRLGLIGNRTLQQDLNRWWARVRGKPDPLLKIGEVDHGNQEGEYIWALRNLSFEVKEGEILGIIGRNGAGKSTLLKILSRITGPTSGEVKVKGRVGSLLEVGTGFHAELTGRENIYLNGAILGMRRTEIDRKFDEIVDFSGVEKFIDTPVKRYSSGMYVRLAFAVAAHLDPDILVVDEVLAVGDVKFQEKCLGKMRDVTEQGRTVLFVSHNMATIKSLVDRAMLLDAGKVVCDGGVDRVVDMYLAAGRDVSISQAGIIPDNVPRTGTGEAYFRAVELLNAAGEPISQLYFGESFRVALTIEMAKRIEDAVVEVGISTLDGTRITSSFTCDGEFQPLILPMGWSKVCLDLKPILLPRAYTIDVGVHHLNSGLTIDMLTKVLDFSVLNVAKSGVDHHLPTKVRGFVRPVGRWHSPEPTSALI